MKAIEILKSRTLCHQPGKYIGWPSTATGPDGTIHVVFSGDRDAHVCPFGKIFLLQSRDSGETWSTPRIIADSPLDDRDTGICVCPDGTVVVSWFTSHFEDYAWQYQAEYVRCYPNAEDRWPAWQRKVARISEDTIAQWAPSVESPGGKDFLKRWMGFWTIRSKDRGTTWDKPALSPVYAPHGPAVLTNGNLLYVGMRHLARPQGDETVGVALSRDQGLTWDMLSTIPGFPPYRGPLPQGEASLGEPHVVETQTGKLIAMARYEETQDPAHPTVSRLWQFDSLDGGNTWTPPRETEIVGKPPCLALLRSGEVLVSYGVRHAPFSQCVRFSFDDGATWDFRDETILCKAPCSDMGYLSTTEFARGNFLSVYYQKEDPEGKTVLAATRWNRLESA